MKTISAAWAAKLIISLTLLFAGADAELVDTFSDMPEDAVAVWAVFGR